MMSGSNLRVCNTRRLGTLRLFSFQTLVGQFSTSGTLHIQLN